MIRVFNNALWRCPCCKRQFVTRNMWHTCSDRRIDDHFTGKGQSVRELFEKLRTFMETCGPLTVYAQKNRIVFQAHTRFAGAVPRKQSLECSFWLRRRCSHPLITRIERPMSHDYIHYFRLTDWRDFDKALADLIREAYQAGSLEYVATA